MLYIVTARRSTAPDAGGRRTAAATLKAARALAVSHCLQSAPPGGVTNRDIAAIAAVVGPDGGRLGPLPDGTVIDVEAVDEQTLARLAGIEAPGAEPAAVVEAFNAAHVG